VQRAHQRLGLRKHPVERGGLLKRGRIELDECIEGGTALVVGRYPIQIGLHQLNAAQPAVEIGRLNVADGGLFQREIHAKLR
jgi:hypothetical protein